MTGLFVFAALILFHQVSFAQVTGHVRDSGSGRPVPGATVIFPDNSGGVVTDPEGYFKIDKASEGIYSVRAIGFRTATFRITRDREKYVINLDPAGYELEEVSVTAYNKSRRLVDVPGSLSLIPAGQIERDQPVTVVPLLNHVPGVFAHSGALNTSRITIRGIGARVPYATGKIRAYLNNIPLTNGSGISIVEDIDPSVMERIEIIKGPATSIYGAGLGGTIVITARRPGLHPAGISNTAQAGSWNLFRNSVGLDAGTGNIHMSMNYNHTRSDGYRQNNQYRRDGITAVSQYDGGENTLVTLLLNYTSLKAHIPSSIDSATYSGSPRSAAANWLRTRGYEDYDKLLAGISAQHSFSPSLTASLSVFTTLNREMEMRPFDVLNEGRFSGGTRISIARTGRALGGNWQVLAGSEIYDEVFTYTSYQNIGGAGEKGDRISDNRENILYYNLFSQFDLELGRLNFSSGINLNSSRTDHTDLFNTGSANASGRYSYGRIWSPRISANYRYYKSNSFFLTLSHGFSPPSLAETFTPEGFINPGIMPETSWNLEGGIRGNLLDNHLFYDLNIYTMRVTNLLVAERVGEDAWVGRNAGESLHRGLEGEFHFIMMRNPEADRWWIPAEIRFSPNVAVNNFRFTDFVDEGVDHSGNRLPGIPRIVMNTMVTADLSGGLAITAGFRHVGEVPMNDANSRHYDSYNLTNLSVAYRSWLTGNLKAEAYLHTGNLFNVRYASMILVNAPSFGNAPPRYYYPGHPLNFRAGIKLSYRFN